MHVIILAAGMSKRFQDDGYATPKPFLRLTWRGKEQTMLEHVLATIPLEFKDVVVAVHPNRANSVPTDKRITAIHVEKTKGPAHTALKTLRSLSPESTLILDVDVLNFTNDLYRLTQLPTMGVLVNKSANPSFSYVDKLGAFDHIHEKRRISKYAVRGAYFIPQLLVSTFMDIIDKKMQLISEPFISHMFNHVQNKKTALEVTYTPVEWGTPRDVRLSGAHITTPREIPNAHDRSQQHSGRSA